MWDLQVPPQTFFLFLPMYLCYLDESGVPQKNPGTTPYFVLLGLAIPARTWRAKDAEIAALSNARNFYGELHTAWMARMYPEQERIPGFMQLDPESRRRAVLTERRTDLARASLHGSSAVKQLRVRSKKSPSPLDPHWCGEVGLRKCAQTHDLDLGILSRTLKSEGRIATLGFLDRTQLSKNYAKTDAYIHLAHDERLAILREAADRIAAWDDAVIFADVQRKAANTGDENQILDHAFEQVVTRFHHFLERQQVEVGIVVQDRNETAARRLTQLARKYHSGGTRYSQVSRLVETPLFVDSSLTSTVQLADLCAYAVRRNFENGETDRLDRLYPRFDRTADRLVGIRHYTGKHPCTCRVCVDHGRPPAPPRR